MFKKIILISILSLSVFVTPVLAAPAGVGKAGEMLEEVAGTDKTGLQSDWKVMLNNVITVALSLVGTIFLVLTIYAGIRWMTAGGNEDSIATAKKVLIAAIIGLVITMSAYAISSFVTTKLVSATTSAGQQ